LLPGYPLPAKLLFGGLKVTENLIVDAKDEMNGDIL
jgi:hypothetical protein